MIKVRNETASFAEVASVLHPTQLHKLANLKDTHWKFIKTPGTLSHSISPHHVVEQLTLGAITSKSRYPGYKPDFLFVHMTTEKPNPHLMTEEYPGPFSQTFGCALVFTDQLAQRAMMLEIPNDLLAHLINPMLSLLQSKQIWQADSHPKIFNEISSRLKRQDIRIITGEDTDPQRLLTILASTWNLRVLKKYLSAPLFNMSDTIGSNIAQINNNIIVPLFPTKADIEFAVMK